MTLDRMLAWVGILLALVGLFPVVHDSHLWAGTLLLVIAVLCAYLGVREYQITRNKITLLQVKKTLTIHDGKGERATLETQYKVRANVGNDVNEIWFRKMVSDGSTSDVKIEGLKPSDSTHLGCLYDYCYRFNAPLRKGEERTVTLVCTVSNAFPQHQEGLLHEVGHTTKCVVLEVNFPEERKCNTQSAALTFTAGGESATRYNKDPEVTNNGRQIISEIKFPRVGYTYELGWEW